MNPEIRIFQFVSLERPRLLARLISRFVPYRATIVFDLEDNLWDPDDAELSRKRKVQARRDLHEMAVSSPAAFQILPTAVRVNRISSVEFMADLELLVPLSKLAVISAIIVPKVESAGELFAYARCFSDRHVNFRELIPIIETRAGVQKIKEILSAVPDLPIRFINYGHNDYCLDAGYWPFLAQSDPRFWEMVAPFIEQVEGRGCRYFHTPFAEIADDGQFKAILARLCRLCRQEFAISALGARQMAIARAGDFTTGAADAENRPAVTSLEERMEMAERIRRLYVGNRRRNHGYAIDSQSGRFIAPHEYSAAVNFLAKHGR